MGRLRWAATVGLTAWAVCAVAADRPFGPKADACGNHGTSVEFLDSPRDAAAQAKREQKLVFALHVSGHFEDPRFT